MSRIPQSKVKELLHYDRDIGCDVKIQGIAKIALKRIEVLEAELSLT